MHDGLYFFVVEPDTFEITATFDMTYYTNNSVIVSTVSNPVVEQDILLVNRGAGQRSGRESLHGRAASVRAV